MICHSSRNYGHGIGSKVLSVTAGLNRRRMRCTGQLIRASQASLVLISKEVVPSLDLEENSENTAL